MTITIRKYTNYCTFHHLVDDELVYVGFGSTLTSLDLKHIWNDPTIPNRAKITIEYVLTSNDPAQCRVKAQQDIAMLWPRMNGHRPAMNRKAGPVRCLDDSRVYRNASIAAKTYGITPATMANHLNEKPGYKLIHGKEFERCSVEAWIEYEQRKAMSEL